MAETKRRSSALDLRRSEDVVTRIRAGDTVLPSDLAPDLRHRVLSPLTSDEVEIVGGMIDAVDQALDTAGRSLTLRPPLCPTAAAQRQHE